MAIAIGIKVPLNYSEDGFQPTLTIAEEAVEDMTNLVLTNKGELAWNESFGVGLEKYLFENDTETLRTDLASSIATQVATYISYIEFLGVEFQDVTDTGVLSIVVNYAIKDAGTLQPTTSLGFLFDPASGMVGAPSTAPAQVPIGMQNPNL